MSKKGNKIDIAKIKVSKADWKKESKELNAAQKDLAKLIAQRHGKTFRKLAKE